MPVWEDSDGMIWQEEFIDSPKRGRKEDFKPNVMGKQGYEAPEGLKVFKHLKQIGLDIETFDPHLLTKGAGCYRDDGSKIVGVAIAYSKTDATYYPTAHANMDKCMQNPENFYSHLREEAKEYKGKLVGANLIYDLDWLSAEQGIHFPKAQIRDVQTAEPLLDENKRSYKLDILCGDYLRDSKYTQTLLELYGRDFIKHMDMVDPGWAGEYAEQDTLQPQAILEKQLPALEKQGLMDLFEMESRLTPLLVQMRGVGVRVDIEKAEQVLAWTKEQSELTEEKITHATGMFVDVGSGPSIARAFEALDIPYPKTDKGNPSFRAEWLNAHPAPIAKLIVEKRQYDKIGGTFINNYILEGHTNGRIHANFNQLRSDMYGAATGRFSSSNPNLQNIPVRHPVLGPLMRSMFIPEEGMDWGCADWSQIEYRFLVHYAHLMPGIDAQRAVDMYLNDPDMDFHALAAAITGIERGPAKNINFGVVYGMGVAKMAASLGVSFDEAKAILETFHTEMPFLKGMLNAASARVAKRGLIKTILGRRRRFTQWEYGKFTFNTREEAFAAKKEFPSRYYPRRAKTHKALNALLQGSAADLMKKAMVDMYEDGLFDVLVPHLTVHDELDVSIPQTKAGREAFKEMVHIMENSMKLVVPVFVDANSGKNWDEAK